MHVRAISYTGSRITAVSVQLDGRTAGTCYSAPYEVAIPWKAAGGGDHVLAVTASDASGESATVKRTVRVSPYFDLLPADGATLSGNLVRVSWTGHGFGPGRVRCRSQGAAAWQEAVGESGRERVVLLPNLEPGKPYEFQPLGGPKPGPTRTVTRVKGLAFGKTRYGANIARDYDQRVPISVRNHAEKPLLVNLVCGKPDHPELLLSFIGQGSEDKPVNLPPGEEREFLLVFSAQDAVHPTYRVPLRITSASGFSDEAEVEVNVKLPEVKLEWKPLGPGRSILSQRFRIHNRADTLTDLAVFSDSRDVNISPTIRHGLLPANDHVDVLVWPRLREGFTGIDATLIARGVNKTYEHPFAAKLGEGNKLFQAFLIPGVDPSDPSQREQIDLLKQRYEAAQSLDPNKLDWALAERPEDVDGDGRLDRWYLPQGDTLWSGDDTDGDGQVDFVHADVGNDGVAEYSAYKTKDGWQTTNLVDAWLEMGFTLPYGKAAYQPHDADIVMNGAVIGRLRDTIPNGTYLFRIPPQVLRFEGSQPGGNRIGIQSKHLRGGHYVVSSDFRFKFRLTSTPVWTVAKTQAEASRKAANVEGLSVAGPDYVVASSEVKVVAPKELKKGAEVSIEAPIRNMGATAPPVVEVALTKVLPGQPPVELTRVAVADVPMSGCVIARVPWKADAGTHDLRLVVDPDNVLNDMSRENNEASIQISVPGDDQKPEMEVLEPQDRGVLKQTVAVLRAQVTDDSGFVAVDVSVDGGLWQRLPREADAAFAGLCLLQPGGHSIRLRATDGGGNQVEQTLRVTVEAEAPDAKIASPAPGSAIDARAAAVRVECPADAALVAARVAGGPWLRAQQQGQTAEATVPLRFGAQTIEALVANRSGAVRIVSASVQCTKQPDPDEPPAALAAGQGDGVVQIDGVGPINLFRLQNGLCTRERNQP